MKMARKQQSVFFSNIMATVSAISDVAKIVRAKSAARHHLADLCNKYPPQVVQRMRNEKTWEGQTAVELRDSLGEPHGVDRKRFATRKREIWKYHPNGTNRYKLRIILDNDVVVGWDSKG